MGDDGHSLDPDPLRDLNQDLCELLALLECLLVTALAPLDVHHQLIDPLRHLTVILVIIVTLVMMTFLLIMEDTIRPRQPTVPVISLAAYMTLECRKVEIRLNQGKRQRDSLHLLVSGTEVLGLTRDTAANILHY